MRNLLKTCCDNIAKVCSNVKKILITRGSSSKLCITIVLWIEWIFVFSWFYSSITSDAKNTLYVVITSAAVALVLYVVLYLSKIVWPDTKKILIPGESSTEEIRITIVLWIVSIWIVPLFYYVLVINDKKKSLEVNKLLVAVICVLYAVLFSYRSLIQFQHRTIMWLFFFTECLPLLFVYYPLYDLSQATSVNGSAFSPVTTSMNGSIFSMLVIGVLSSHLLGVFGIYILFTKQVTRISRKPAKATGIKIALNLVLYLFGGHLFGGLWYLSALWKRVGCWIEACKNHGGCHHSSHGFNITLGGFNTTLGGFKITLGDNSFLNSTCLMNDTQNTKLGIVEKAFQTGITEEKDVAKKWLYCFRWGLQNLSNFGQNLEVTTHYWENIFVIFLALYGMATFIYFIGNMQMLINSATEKSKEERQKEEEMRRQEKEMRRQEEEIRRRQQEIEQWFPFKKFSEELQNSIKEYKQYTWQQTEGVNVENLLNNLPIDLQKSVKCNICLQMLKNIEKFQRWSEASLVHICDCIKPVVYTERTCIVNEGDPIIEMYFVLQGNLWTYSSWSSTNNVPQDNNLLTYGDFWGEELVSWAQNELSLSNIPRSNRTIEAHTKVEAFALMAGDLKDTFIKHNQGAQVIQSYFRRKRMRALRRNAQTSAQEQAPAAELSGLDIVVVQE